MGNPPRPPRSLRDKSKQGPNNPSPTPEEGVIGSGTLGSSQGIGSGSIGSGSIGSGQGIGTGTTQIAKTKEEGAVKPEHFINNNPEPKPEKEVIEQKKEKEIEEKKKEVESKVKVLSVRENKKKPKNKETITKEDVEREARKVKEQVEEVEEVVFEVKEEIKNETNKFVQGITAIGLKTFETVLTAPKNLLMKVFFRKKWKSTEQKKEEAVSKVKVKELPKIKYASLLSQKIEFYTYDKQPLVDPSFTGVALEEVFMSNVLADVKYCVKYVVDLPNPTQGVYAFRKITEIFENVTSEDINRFLYYVNSNPNAFTGNNYKFSEAFATWIIRKSHELFK